jgi:CRP-like cAMP-binding protein
MSYEIQLLRYLQRFVPVTEHEFKSYILPSVVTRKFGKKQIVTNEGEVENYYNFIASGLARKYYKKNKEEINTQISCEGQVIHAHESFHSRAPSEYIVETIEPCTFLSLTYDDQENTYLKYPKLERLGRLAITSLFVIKDRWQMKMIKLTPRERFLNFVTKNPELMQRVPQKFLASYLNIKPETFSRFKHLLRSHSKSTVATH